MSFNLLDLAKNYLTTGEVVKAASALLGESEAGTSSALSAVIPSVLGTLVQKSTTSDGATGIMDLLKLGSHDGSILDNITGMFSGGDQTNGLLSTGGTVVKSLLGDKAAGLIDLIADFAGVKQSTTASLLSLATPVLLGIIGKKANADGLEAGGLMTMLTNQASNIQNGMPSGIASGLTSLLGLGNLGNLGSVANTVKSTVPTANVSSIVTETTKHASSTENKEERGFSWWWLLLPLALVGLFFAMRGCNKQSAVVDAVNQAPTVTVDTTSAIPKGEARSTGADVVDAAANAVKGTVNAAGDWVMDLGKMMMVALPDGTKLDLGEKSGENLLINFIKDESKVVDKTTWFTLDRLYFETGKSTLKPESQAQVKNIAAILKAFPNVELRLGGYTDNTGKAESNLKLSTARANAAMKELVKAGVAAKRLTAEGYGQEHPVCAANDTPECRAQNRRIDVRVTKK